MCFSKFLKLFQCLFLTFQLTTNLATRKNNLSEKVPDNCVVLYFCKKNLIYFCKTVKSLCSFCKDDEYVEINFAKLKIIHFIYILKYIFSFAI